MTEKTDELLGLEFKVDGFDDTTMSNGEKAFIIYLTIDNKTPQSRKINLLDAIYVTNKREQLEQDIWLSGYLIREDTLKPNSFKKAGLVFYKSKLKTISDNDLIYITTELPTEGQELTLCFRKTGLEWVLTNKEVTDIEIKFTPKQLEKSLLKRIERLESFEERLGVVIQNLSIKIESGGDSFTLFCELHSVSGTTINETIYVECIFYDRDGLIIGKENFTIFKDDFFGFAVCRFHLYEEGISERINKIRIYPKT